MYKKNPFEFDCPCCGNPLNKHRNKNVIRCIWCRSYVDYNGNIIPPNKAIEKSGRKQPSVPTNS